MLYVRERKTITRIREGKEEDLRKRKGKGWDEDRRGGGEEQRRGGGWREERSNRPAKQN